MRGGQTGHRQGLIAHYRFAFLIVAVLLVFGSAVLLVVDHVRRAETLELGAGVVATVDGEPITARSFVDEMIRRARRAPGLFSDPRDKRALLEERIRFEVLVARARAADYEQDPEIVRRWKQLLVRKYESDHLDARVAELTVSDQEIERHYRTHLADYTVPERRRIALIFIEVPSRASEERIAKLTRRAEEALAAARAEQGARSHFGVLAKKYSDDRVSKYLGGDVGWISRGQNSYRWEPAVVETMLALSEPRDISPILRTGKGFYLLKLIAAEKARPQPLERIRPTIRHTLLNAKRKRLAEDFHAELEAQTHIEIDHEMLESLQLPQSIARKQGAVGPPPLPGG